MADDVFDFSSLITERTRTFTGREWLFARIERWLGDPSGSAFFLLSGPPGTGKSAIAARFIQQRRDVAAYHFCVTRNASTIDPALFVRALSHQFSRSCPRFAEALLKDSKVDVKAFLNIGISYGDVIGVKIENLVVNSPSAAVAFVHAVVEPLKEVCRGSGLDDAALIIVLDGLDEAVQHLGRETIVSLLTTAGPFPQRVRWLLTSRGDAVVLNALESLPVTHFVLSDETREASLDDVRQYVLQEVRHSVNAAALQANIAQFGIAPGTLADEIARASGGNFLYVVWLLRAIAADARQLASLSQLPDGIDGVYRDFLRTRRLGDDRQAWRTLYRPVLGLLAVARSELTVHQLTRLAELNDQDVADAIADLQQFLDPAVAQGHCQLYHKSVVDFLGDKTRAGEFWISKPDAHQRIVAHYRGRADAWSAMTWKQVDEYGLMHLAAHLYELDGDRRELYCLLTREFMREKCRRFGSDRAFFADLGLALDAAAVQAPPNVVEEVRLSLLQATLATAASEVPAEALGALAWTGHADRAFDYIAMIQDDWRKVLAYKAVCAALLAEGLHELAAGGVQSGLDEVSKMTESVDSWLTHLIPLAVQTGNSARVAAIVDKIGDLRDWADTQLELAAAQVGAGLMSELDGTIKDLQSALDAIEPLHAKAVVLATASRVHHLAGRPDDARRDAREAYAAFVTIEPAARLGVIFKLGPALIAAGMFDEAQSIIDALPQDRDQSMMVLTGLVDAFVNAGELERAAATARAARELVSRTSAGRRGETSQGLVGALIQTGLFDLARDEAAHARDRDEGAKVLASALARHGHLDAALDILEEGENSELAADVLRFAKLESAAPEALERALQLRPVRDASARKELAALLALAFARRGEKDRPLGLVEQVLVDTDFDNESLARALGSIATALASNGPDGRSGEIADRALRTLDAMDNEWALARVLPDLMPILVATGRTAAARDALMRIKDPVDRESAEAALASALGEAVEAASENIAEPGEPSDPEDEAEEDELTRLCQTAERLFEAGEAAQATELAKRALSLAVANAPTITEDAGTSTTWTTNPSLPLIWVARVSLFAGLLDTLVSSASLLSSMSSRAEALSGIASSIHEAEETSKSVDIWRKALKPARIDSRWRVLRTLEDGARLLYDLNAGETLWAIAEAIREIEAWWAPTDVGGGSSLVSNGPCPVIQGAISVATSIPIVNLLNPPSGLTGLTPQ